MRCGAESIWIPFFLTPQSQVNVPLPSLLLYFLYMESEVYFLDLWIEAENLQIDPEILQIPGH